MEHERTSPTADSPQASAELHELARRLMRQACELGSFKSAHEVSASARGLPAIMRVLMEADGSVSPGELARRTGVTDARIANALRALEHRGFISRCASTKDRRRVEVSLTESGRESIVRHGEEAECFIVDYLGELGLEDARDLVRLVGRILEVISARAEQGRDVMPHVPEAMFADGATLGDKAGKED